MILLVQELTEPPKQIDPSARRLRVAIAGLHIESSTFSPHLSSFDDFAVTRGEALLARYGWLGDQWAEEVEWIPVLHARALPGGAVAAEAYEAWAGEIVATLGEVGPVDGLLFDIHGAMSVVGLDDAEGDLITRIRAVLGPDPLVSAAMDLHGNVSPTLFERCDLLTCYRTAPHIDVWETRERAARNLVAALRRGERPAKALVRVPILLPGEMTSTRIEPARSLYARVPEIAARAGVIDAAVWIGYPWADQPRCHGVVVVTGTDGGVAREAALELGTRFWEARDEFAFVAPTGSMEECLEQALSAVADPARRPFFISDSGDNPGAGGAGDVTCAVSRLLAEQRILDGSVRVVLASLVDPAAVDAACAVAVGEPVTVQAGGRIDAREPGPVLLDGVLEAVAEDPAGGRCVSVRVGGLSVILTSRRMQYGEVGSYQRLGLSIVDMDLVVVKIGYLEPELFEVAGDWLLALTPGGVDQHLERLPYHHLSRPVHPMDRDFTAELTVHMGQ